MFQNNFERDVSLASVSIPLKCGKVLRCQNILGNYSMCDSSVPTYPTFELYHKHFPHYRLSNDKNIIVCKT